MYVTARRSENGTQLYGEYWYPWPDIDVDVVEIVTVLSVEATMSVTCFGVTTCVDSEVDDYTTARYSFPDDGGQTPGPLLSCIRELSILSTDAESSRVPGLESSLRPLSFPFWKLPVDHDQV